MELKFNKNGSVVKSQRIIVYDLLKKVFDEEYSEKFIEIQYKNETIITHNDDGFCLVVVDILFCVFSYPYFRTYKLLSFFPELEQIRPKDYDVYWWETNSKKGYELRKESLTKLKY